MRSAVRAGRPGALPAAYFAPPAGTFAFSSSNQFWIRLMWVTGGCGGAGTAKRLWDG